MVFSFFSACLLDKPDDNCVTVNEVCKSLSFAFLISLKAEASCLMLILYKLQEVAVKILAEQDFPAECLKEFLKEVVFLLSVDSILSLLNYNLVLLDGL